jgi:hypothetical protein
MIIGVIKESKARHDPSDRMNRTPGPPGSRPTATLGGVPSLAVEGGRDEPD